MITKQRFLSLLLCSAMLFSVYPTSAFAEATTKDSDVSVGTSGLCEHHPKHDEACGYTKSAEGMPCNHEHTEDCCKPVEKCVHEHMGECYPQESLLGNLVTPPDAEEREPANCAHVCSEESGCITKELDCMHEHTEDCGYLLTTEGTPCGFVCKVCTPQDSGAPTALEGLNEEIAAPSNAVVLADADTTVNKAIMPETTGISSPASVTTGKGIYYAPNDYIYFGINSEDGDKPIKWRVLAATGGNDTSQSVYDGATTYDNAGSTVDGDKAMFLLSEYLLGDKAKVNRLLTIPFNCVNSNEWQNSDAQKWCKSFAEEPSNFSAEEQAAMLGTTKSDGENSLLFSVPGLKWEKSELKTEKLFFLSVSELSAFVGNYNQAPGFAAALEGKNAFNSWEANNWWMRSPFVRSPTYNDPAGLVDRNGFASSYNVLNTNNVPATTSVRPAFNLNLNSVLFSSAAEGGKPDGGLQKVADYSGNEWKLTLKDSSRDDFAADCIAYTETKAVISYENTIIGENEYISVIIEDSGEYTHYGRLKNLTDSSDASGTVEIDLTGIDITGKTLYVFNEQYNDDKTTDYTSDLKQVAVLQKNACNVDFTLSNGLSTDGKNYCFMNADYTTTLTADSSHILPDSITVTVGGKTLPAAEYTYENGTLTIPASNITDDITITASGVEAKSKVSVSPESHTFTEKHVGYTDAQEQTFTIKNTGNQQITNLSVSLSGNVFTLIQPAQTELAPNDTAAFTVRPDTGFAAGEHEVTANITGSNGVAATVNLSFTVSDHQWNKGLTHNDTHHWHECTVGSCTEKNGEAEHNFGGGKICTDCGYSTADAATPNITGQPQGYTCNIGDTVTLTVTANASDGGSLFYQWYSNTTNSNLGGSIITGATDPVYTPPTAQAGTAYYYCVVTNTNTNATGAQTVTATSSPAEIVVSPAAPNQYTVTVQDDGNGTASASPLSAPVGETITLTANANPGCHFEKWEVVSGGVTISGNSFNMPANDVTVKAIFEKDSPILPTEYTITFDGNGGTNPAPQTTTGGKLKNLPTSTQSGYSFNGWYTAAAGGEKITLSTTFTADATVYAHWTYNGGGGGGDYTTPTYISRTLSKDGVTVTGSSIYQYAALTVEKNRLHNSGNCDSCGQIREWQGQSRVISIYDVALSHSFRGTVTITFPVSSEYNGKTLTVAHCLKNKLETYDVTVSNGKVTVTVNSLSPFAILDNSEDEPGKENPDTGVTNPFTDAGETSWFFNDVMFVYEKGLMAGTSATTFSPGSNTTRAQLAVIFYRIEGSPEVEGRNGFTDVEYGPGTAWYYDAVTWAKQSGIMSGYGNGAFGPGNPITREQLAAIFCRYAQYKGYDVAAAGSLDRFTDKDKVSAWAKEALTWAVSSGIVNGTGSSQLSPQGTTTRAQIAAMLHRFMDRYEQDEHRSVITTG